MRARSTRFVLALPLLAAGLALAPRGAPRAEEDRPIVLTDVTDASGLGAAKGDRFSFADVDGDGDPDLLVEGARLWRNDTKPSGKDDAAIRFTDVTAESGTSAGPGGGAVWADLDADGDLDAVTTGGAVKIQVAPGRFRDEAAAWGLRLRKPMAAVGVGDVDGDGRPDVLFAGGEDWNGGNPVYFPRVLLRNVEGKRFDEVTETHELGGERYGRAVAFADHDADGDLDVYLGNYRLQANELLVNAGGTLRNRGKAAGVEGRWSEDRTTLGSGQRLGFRYGHTIASSWADLDADGDLDLWVSNLVHKYAGPAPESQGGWDVRGWICDDSAIYRSDGPPAWGFTDVREASGIPLRPVGPQGVFQGDELWSNAAIADLDLDGLPEVFVPQVYTLPYSHSLLFRNRGGFHFEEVSGSVGVRRFDSYGAAFADLDGDGDPDLVVEGRGTPEGERGIRVYRNDTPRAGEWLAYRLHGARGDPMPIGAQVVLAFEDGSRMVRQVEGGMGSHAQQNEEVLRFGLGGRKVREGFVRWPGGILQPLPAPVPGRVVDVRLPDKRPPAIRFDAPERAEDGSARLRARAERTAGYAWAFDLDGDGVFETVSRDGTATLPAGGPARGPAEGPCEVRVRLVPRAKGGLSAEAVLRLD